MMISSRLVTWLLKVMLGIFCFHQTHYRPDGPNELKDSCECAVHGVDMLFRWFPDPLTNTTDLQSSKHKPVFTLEGDLDMT